jgi:hypothetical protein
MAKNELYATEALSIARNERKVTQLEMANILSIKLKRDISLWLYQKWEYSKRPVSTDDALAISRELELPLNLLWRVK